jgi:hypothetical protein
MHKAADGLYVGSYVNIAEMKSLASFETLLHSSPEKSNLPTFTFYIIYSSVDPLNGGYPDNKMYKITPQLQISHFSSYFFFNTSGAI